MLLWAALPPVDWWPLAWIAPACWAWLARQEQLAGRRPYLTLWVIGLLFWLAALHWLRLPHWATSFGWLALSVYFAFYVPLFVGLTRVAVHRLRIPLVLAAPVVWSGLELARAHLLTGMTMASLGHTQYRWIGLIQVSDLAGAYAVSFVVMFVAACLARMVPCGGRTWSVWPAPAALAMIGATLGYGYWRTAGDYTRPGARVALIQGSIDTEMRNDDSKRAEVYRHYVGLSRDAIDKYGKVDLVVWPETMFLQTLVTFDPDAKVPEEFDRPQVEFLGWLRLAARQTEERMGELAQTLGAPLVLGVDTRHFHSQGIRYYNSAVFVTRAGELTGRYDKMHLVLFGEYVPFAQYAAWLHRLTPLSVSITAGDRPAAFEVDVDAAPRRRVRLAPSICYETVLPHVIRGQLNRLAARGLEPDVMVNLTNDGWFWGSSELDMHLICGVFRAVECRKPLVIAANTGFSAWIDGDGRILAQGPRRQADTRLADVRLDSRHSWYRRCGDWPAGICLTACGVFALAGIWGWWRRRGAN